MTERTETDTFDEWWCRHPEAYVFRSIGGTETCSRCGARACTADSELRDALTRVRNMFAGSSHLGERLALRCVAATLAGYRRGGPLDASVVDWGDIELEPVSPRLD